MIHSISQSAPKSLKSINCDDGGGWWTKGGIVFLAEILEKTRLQLKKGEMQVLLSKVLLSCLVEKEGVTLL
jgi:hypothetical protein